MGKEIEPHMSFSLLLSPEFTIRLLFCASKQLFLYYSNLPGYANKIPMSGKIIKIQSLVI